MHLFAVERSERGINLLGSVITVTLALASLTAWIGRRPYVAKLMAAFAVGAFVTLLATMIARRRWPAPIPPEVIKGYRFDSIDLHYRVTDDRTFHHFSASYLIEAVRAGVNHVEQRFYWSGRGHIDVAVVSEGHALMGPPRPSGYFKYFYIFLGRELAQGDKATVKHTISCRAETATSVQPFLRREVRDPTGQLLLRVSLPRDAAVTEARGEVWRRADDRVIESSSVEIDSESNEMRWEISKPKEGHAYALRWEWPQDWTPQSIRHDSYRIPERIIQINRPLQRIQNGLALKQVRRIADDQTSRCLTAWETGVAGLS
jgi:hypothetical protein